MTFWNQILPVVTLILGSALALAGDALRRRGDIKRETAAREALRAEARQDRRDDFERERLLQARSALIDLARATSVAHQNDQRLAREGVAYGTTRRDESVTEAERIANRAANETIGLILDDAVRESALSAQKALGEAGMLAVNSSIFGQPAPSAEDGARVMNKASIVLAEALSAIDARVRTLMIA